MTLLNPTPTPTRPAEIAPVLLIPPANVEISIRSMPDPAEPAEIRPPFMIFPVNVETLSKIPVVPAVIAPLLVIPPVNFKSLWEMSMPKACAEISPLLANSSGERRDPGQVDARDAPRERATVGDAASKDRNAEQGNIGAGGDRAVAGDGDPAGNHAATADLNAAAVARIVPPSTMAPLIVAVATPIPVVAAIVPLLTTLPTKDETGVDPKVAAPIRMPVPVAEIMPLLLMVPEKIEINPISMPMRAVISPVLTIPPPAFDAL